MKPDEQTREILRNIQTEINCGKVLLITERAEEVWNNACERAIQIVQNYAEGYGLFQMTADIKTRAVSAPVETPGLGTRPLDSAPEQPIRKSRGTGRKAR